MNPLGIEEFRLLAECERKMDAGEIPYVRLSGQGHRIAMDSQAMGDLGLTQGLTVTATMFSVILKYLLERCSAQIAFERGQKLVEEESPS